MIALCYNHERFVLECLESIRGQTFQHFQLIVTDDASSDRSAEMIASWLATHKPDAIFIRRSENVGLCKILNQAVACSTGTYISMIATDDVWEASKIEAQLGVMRACTSSVAVVYSDAIQIDEAGARLAKDFIDEQRPDFTPPSGRIFAALAHDNFIPAMATLIRRDAIESVGGYDERLLFEDYDMWLRLARRYEFVFIDAKLARYRVVSTSLVRAGKTERAAWNAYTFFRLHEAKLVGNLISPAERKRQVAKQADLAYYLYVLGDPRVTSCLWISAWRARSLRLLLLACLSAVGIDRARAQKIRAKLFSAS